MSEQRMEDIDCFLDLFKNAMTPLEYEEFYISFRIHPRFDELLEKKNKVTRIQCVNMIHDILKRIDNNDRIKCAFSDAVVYICQRM